MSYLKEAFVLIFFDCVCLLFDMLQANIDLISHYYLRNVSIN